MTTDLSVTTPPTILLFGPLDPTSAHYLMADAQTCVINGCHPVSVVTALHIQDTTAIEHISLLPPEQIHDQLRFLLEDLSIQAIKAGPIYTVEEASILGQVIADYTHIPLVLHLHSVPETEQVGEDIDTNEVVDAILHLVVPFADLVLADELLLQQWQAEGHFPTNQNPVQNLFDYGAKAVLCPTTHRTQQASYYQLYYQKKLSKQWPRQHTAQRVQDTEGMLACLCTLQLAQTSQLALACEQALHILHRATKHVFQAGMGARLINQSALIETTTPVKSHEA